MLLDFGELVINFADVVVYEVRGYYTDALIALLKRNELDLAQLTLANVDEDMKPAKLEIATRYRNFLQNMLKFTLRKMNVKGSSNKLQHFIETFFAMAYFRIPLFRKKYLSCLMQKSFRPIEDWRSTELDLEDYDPEGKE